MKILILGVTGYVGRKVSDRLVSLGYQILGLSRTNISIPGIDMFLAEDYERVFQEHPDLACIINLSGVYEKPGISLEDILEGNLYYPLRVMLHFKETKVRKIINIATSLPENLNLYTVSKKKLSEFGQWMTESDTEGSLTFLNVLLENYYGEQEPENRFLSYVTRNLMDNQDIDMTTGEQHRDFIYISDVVDGIIRLIENQQPAGYADVSLGTGEAPSIREIVEYLRDISHSTSTIHFGAIPKRKHEPDSVADRENMSRFGIVPAFSWKEGMKKLVEYRREHRER